MNAIDEFIYVTLGWTWVLDWTSIILIVAAALALILLIVLLIVIPVRHSKNKKRFLAMQAEINELRSQTPARDEGAYRAEVRAEIEPIVRSELEKEYANKPVNDEAAQKKINELNATIKEKDKRIDELGSALMQANSAHKTDNTELYRTINDLNQDKRALQNDVNILKAENAQLKAQAQQTQGTAATTTVEKKATAAKTTAPKTTATKAKAKTEKPAAKVVLVKQPEPKVEEPPEEDEEDEYYDEFGDETSAIKVTLKFDRVKSNWVINRSDSNRAYRRCATKQEALNVAKDLARRLQAQLVVHKKDGKFQKI